MFELTPEQVGAINAPESTPVRAVDPLTRREYVIMPLDEYERLTAADYDAGDITRDELLALAWEAGRMIGWDDPAMDVYDRLPEKS